MLAQDYLETLEKEDLIKKIRELEEIQALSDELIESQTNMLYDYLKRKWVN